jgi:hypothetical protein
LTDQQIKDEMWANTSIVKDVATLKRYVKKTAMKDAVEKWLEENNE